MNGRTCLITGATDGIGKEAADITITERPNGLCLSIKGLDNTKNNPKHIKFTKINISPMNKLLLTSKLSISIRIRAPDNATINDKDL